MIDFVKLTFPFLAVLEDKGVHVNDICRDPRRGSDAACCSFVFLSALSYSNAFVLGTFPEYVEHMIRLDGCIGELLEVLERQVRGNRMAIPGDLKQRATESAAFLYDKTGILQIEHPIADVVLERISINVKENLKMDDVIKSIGLVYSGVMQVCGGGYTGSVPEARTCRKTLSAACEPFARWADRLIKLKGDVAGHVWSVRHRYLGEIELEDEAGQAEEEMDEQMKQRARQASLEKGLLKKLIDMARDEECVFRNQIDLTDYITATT
ncbi:MAG: hypothetical protein ACYTEL_21265 [Planctomycetota bacterium]|jgi:hypothetical protein